MLFNGWMTKLSKLLLMILILVPNLTYANRIINESRNRKDFVYEENKTEIIVKVLEKDTDEPIVGVVIKMNNKVYMTDVNGYAQIVLNDNSTKKSASKENSTTHSKSKNNPTENYNPETLTLSMIAMGYNPITSKEYNIRGKRKLVVYMVPAKNKLDAVYVRSQKRHTTELQQVYAIDSKQLEKSVALSLGQMLEKIPGVSTISTGSTISKPVIQGMHSSRILLLNNGVRLESQSWGEDHAPEIDHTSSGIIEVIKGAESVRYGYGAIGGVVLFNQAPLLYGYSEFISKSKFNLGYRTNSRGFAGSGTIDMGYKKFGLRLHGMYQRGGDYSTAEYAINNTGYHNISYSAYLGYQGRKLTATLFSSLYTSRTGIYYASKISDIDQLLARFMAGRPEENSFYPKSYRIKPPFQQTQHLTVKGQLKYDFTEKQNLQMMLSYQANIRQEFENRKSEVLSWLPMQDLELTTYSSDFLYTGDFKFLNMHTQAGASGMYQVNYNFPGTKQPAYIPNYAALTVGAFVLSKFSFRNLECSAGMRYDIRAMDVSGYTSLHAFQYYEDFKTYRNFTGSLATHYKFNRHFDIRGNIGWSWRPPDINELYASGLHHGIYWVVGNRGLTAERGYKAILGGEYKDSWYSIEPSVFYQYVNNYIYDNIGEGINRFHNHPTGKYPQFIYEQDNARFFGGDLIATVMPFKGLVFSIKGEWINARNVSQNIWLPFMPSDRYGAIVKYNTDFGRGDRKIHFSCSLDTQYVTKQTHFDPTKDLVPDTPPAYTLFGAEAELVFPLNHERKLKLLLLGENITNKLYKEYTDRFRYYAHAAGANVSIRVIIDL